MSVVPVISTIIERRVTSTTLPRKISQICMTSRALGAVGGDLEQRQLARDRVGRLEVADLQDVDELVQLLGDLVDRVQRTVERQRDPRQVLVVGRADGQRVDVEAAPREQAGDPGQDAGLVLDEDREDVLAARAHPAGRLELLEATAVPWFLARP